MRRPDLGHVFKNVIAIALAMTLSACWNFYAVRSSFSMPENKQRPRDVMKTDAYRAMIATVKRIAVRAPDGCANETSSQSRGEASSREDVLLKTNCGQEMDLLERSLSKAGYKVVSWRVVDARPSADNRAPIEFASQREADILLQVNSLARLTTRAVGDLRWERRIYKSDSRWNIKYPTKVDSRRRDQIVRHAKKSEGRIQPERISVSLNATATSVESGQTIWFYEWTLSGPAEGESVESVSFSACRGETGLCKPWPPRRNRDREKEYSSGIVEAESRSPFEDERRAKHDRLIKLLVSDMVETLKNGAR